MVIVQFFQPWENTDNSFSIIHFIFKENYCNANFSCQESKSISLILSLYIKVMQKHDLNTIVFYVLFTDFADFIYCYSFCSIKVDR